MVNSPLSIYEQQLINGEIKADEQQRLVITQLDKIHKELSVPPKKSLLKPFVSKKTMRGLYLWGSVGIGKTYLMDLFYQCGNYPKLRMHFFTFMRDIHQKLQHYQGQKDPLKKIAYDIAEHAQVICFDEFFVSNIADAMILGELFKHLFTAGIILIATSNTEPDNLYKDGLQRERFLPAIEALKRHTCPADVYFFPLNETTKNHMQASFDFYNNYGDFDHTPLKVNNHQLPVIRKHQGILWCNFQDLCQHNRSQNDYIYLAKHFHTLLIDNVKPIAACDRRTILRFIHLIDIFYDEHVRVVIAAATCAAELYSQGPHEFEFQRTLSRLIEMQSKVYFDRDDSILI